MAVHQTIRYYSETKGDDTRWFCEYSTHYPETQTKPTIVIKEVTEAAVPDEFKPQSISEAV